MQDVRIGKYRHFKGNEYIVLGIAKHSESLEEYVIYQALAEERELWVRPKSMFLEKVNHAGKEIARFEYIGLI